jgi:MFS family permease
MDDLNGERSSALAEPLLLGAHDELPNDASTDEPSSQLEEGANGNVPPMLINPWKNHNVILSLILCIVSGTADSIWCSVVLSGFLLALAKAMGRSSEGNTLVGTAEAAEGLTQLLTALPVGFLADTWGKSKVVRLGGVLMFGTIGITLWALLDIQRLAEESKSAANRSYIILVVALAMWGVINGISNGPSQALFSDSIPRGKRSEMLTWLYSCYLLSSAVGPIVSIVLILTVSANAEDWSIQEIFPVFFLGICLEIPAAILMFFFSDKHVVPEAAEEEQNGCGDNSERCESDIACGEEPNHCDEARPINDEAVDSAELAEPTPTLSKAKACIPYVLFVSSLICSLGSGASVKYFPLFFKEVGFGSAAVQGIFLMVPIVISGFSFVAQEAGRRMGRIQTTVAFDIVGVGLLLLMTWLSRDVGASPKDSPTLWNENPHRALLIVGVYLLRTGAMNCTYPLLESILMDSVPSNHRARWKSLESIASFGWTGSALVGGILSDEHSYQFTFAMTAWTQLCGGLLLLLIQPFVEEEGA